VAVAAAWEVSERTGASLADVLTSVADCLRDEAAVRREAAAQLATVRATARLMAVLPLATLGVFSAGNSGKPLAFLLTSVPGLGCLAGAVIFVSLGLAWVERTAHQATRSAWSP
jgi:tight adherence protein B